MPKLFLHHLIEDHFKPSWWQFWRKQKYHVCQNWGNAVIYEIPAKCALTGKTHEPKQCGRIFDNTITPHCDCGCPTLQASDPAFFQKLDEYLERGCYADGIKIKNEKFVSAISAMPGPSGAKI